MGSKILYYLKIAAMIFIALFMLNIVRENSQAKKWSYKLQDYADELYQTSQMAYGRDSNDRKEMDELLEYIAIQNEELSNKIFDLAVRIYKD